MPPIHRVRGVTEWFEYESDVGYMLLPLQSPDLNPGEQLWEILDWPDVLGQPSPAP